MYILATVFNMKHLSAATIVIIFIIAGVLLLKRFTNYTDKETQYKVIKFSAIAFLVLEIIKLVVMTIDRGEFPMNHIPLHLCSYPLYAVTIVAFTRRDNKISKFLIPSIYSTVMLGGIITILYPVNVIGSDVWFPWEDNFIPFTSFIYHGLMIFLPVYLLVSNFYRPKLSDAWKAISATMVLMVVAIIFNLILDKDYMLLNKGSGSPLAFLLDTHQLVYTFGMIFLGIFMISLSFIIGFLVNRKV